jgi:hypothetical protein
MSQFLYINNRDGFGPRDFTRFLQDRGQFFTHTKNSPQLFEFLVTDTDNADTGTHYVKLVRATSGLQGYWRLGESGGTVAADSSGNDKPGAYSGSPTLGQPGALADGNTAAVFDGVDDLVDVPDNAVFDGVGDFSIEIWFKTNTLVDTNGKLFWKRVGGAGYALHITAATGLLTFECETGSVNNQLNTTGTNWADGAWHHVVATRSGANGSIYVDGSLRAGPTALTSASLANASTLRIGANAPTLDRRFKGSLDEAAYYGRALTASEITAHYNARVDTGSVVSEWLIPKRGSYVEFFDSRWDSRHKQVENGILFTGYITEEPDPVFLGVGAGGKELWAYRVKCTSDEFLANSKRMPALTYVNQTRGFILKDLLQQMFKDSSPMPFNVDGILDGGTEKFYQIDTGQTWAELAQTFAAADGYTYWIINGYVHYGPEDYVTTYSDPAYNLVIDELDPRFTPDNLDITRVARDIVNDITVLGEDEASDIVREHFVSDGYQGAHNLAFVPYGIEANTLIEDDFTADIDTQAWLEGDTGANYIQAFQGALNIIGGPGDPGNAAARTVFLMNRRPIEMSGILEFRDGEIYFPPTPTGSGYVGGLYTNSNLATNNLWCGWKLNATTKTITPMFNGTAQAETYGIILTRHYILRRTIQVDRQLSDQGFTQVSTGSIYTNDNSTVPVRLVITWAIEEINNDNVNSVQSTITTVKTLSTTAVVPGYLIYAATVPNDIHYVTNFLSATRPQQAVLFVDGKPTQLGSYLDGGKATLQDDNDKGKLSWYQIPGSPTVALSYRNTVLGESLHQVPGEGPVGYWRFGEISGIARIDSSGWGNTGTASGGVTQNVQGAINSDSDSANTFNGSTGYITGGPMPLYAFAAGGSFEAWFKTTASGLNTIFSIRNASGIGESFAVYNGQAQYASNYGSFNSVRTGLNDGRWHHVVWTVLNGGGVNFSLYIDGALDSTATISRVPPSNPWVIGADTYVDTITPGVGYFNGSLDEIVVYYGIALSASSALAHYNAGIASSGGAVVTVPKAGSKIALTYYRKQQAKARLKSQTSIDTERERYRDDGIRQRIMRSSDITPAPRTSDECLALAQAVLYDSANPRYEGSYSFDTLQNNATELLFWPRPGDLINCTLTFPDGPVNEPLSIQTVDSEFLGKGAYRIKFGFGPVDRFSTVIRNLILKRQSSLNDPIVQDSVTDSLEALTVGYPYPDDLTDAEVDQTSITATNFTLNLAAAGVPAEVVNYEVREDDTGWGQPNYVVRFRATSRSFTRTKRDIQYFIRPYNAAGIYSRKSAFIRVVAPLANTYQISGVTGNINPTRVRVNITIPRDPDYAGLILRANDANGAIFYKGNGDIHEVCPPDTLVILSSDKMTVDIPNRGYTALAVYCNSYNLLGLEGISQTVVISTVADGSWVSSSATYSANSGGSWSSGAPVTWMKNGFTLTVSVAVTGSTISGTPSILSIVIPNGYTVSRSAKATCALRDGGTRVMGTIEVAATGNTIQIKRLDNAAFTGGSGNNDVEGQIQFEIV